LAGVSRFAERAMLQSLTHSRAERLRGLSARLFQLAELVDQPSRSHRRVEALIDEGESIAYAVRREFR
jgi:hypothetical protein